MAEFDPSQSLDLSPTPVTRDFIGLCIGVLCVVLVILIVALCKWSQCLCLKCNHDSNDQNEHLSSVIQPNTSTPHPHPQQHRSRNQGLSLYNCPGNAYRHISTTRGGLLSPPQEPYNGYCLTDVKAPCITITTVSVQPSQQLVPRLSTSPVISNSSITRSIYSSKQ